jgi:3D (Asp-Asp-Asp) domain-containing protein
MNIEIFRQRVGMVIAAAHIWLSALPLGMLINQGEVMKNTPVEPQTAAVKSIDMKYITYLGYKPVDEPKPVQSSKTITSRGVRTSNVFVVSAYCGENYPHICNNGDASVTATGTRPTEGRTIAVDPSVIPYGTQVIIDGNTYIAEDCGGAIKGNRIDMFFDTHAEAIAWGMRKKEVTIIY